MSQSPTAEAGGGGAGGFTFRVAVIVAGEPWEPVEVTVTCPVYVPAARLAMFALSCSVAGALPPAGDTPSHAASELVVKLSVPEPVLVTLAEAAAGLAPPWVAVNETVNG